MLQVDQYAVNEGLSTEGYMKLIGRQEPASDRYAKTVRTKIDGMDGKSTPYCIVSCQAEVQIVLLCLVYTLVYETIDLSTSSSLFMVASS